MFVALESIAITASPQFVRPSHNALPVATKMSPLVVSITAPARPQIAEPLSGHELGSINSCRSLQSEFQTCVSFPVVASRSRPRIVAARRESPQNRAVIGIDRQGLPVGCGDEEHIVVAAADANAVQVDRRAIDSSIEGDLLAPHRTNVRSSDSRRVARRARATGIPPELRPIVGRSECLRRGHRRGGSDTVLSRARWRGRTAPLERDKASKRTNHDETIHIALQIKTALNCN